MRFRLLSRVVRVFRRLAFLVSKDKVLIGELRSLAVDLLEATTDRPPKEAPHEPAEATGENQGPSEEPTLPISDDVLGALAQQCRVKAEGSRWAAQRLRLKARNPDHRIEIAPRDREIIERAKASGCRLWTKMPWAPLPDDLSLYDSLAACYDALAESLLVMAQVEEELPTHRHFRQKAMALLAEAQSAVREAIRQIGGPTDDVQTAVYYWLRERASRDRIHIVRYMKADDPADPTALDEIAERIRAFGEEVRDAILLSRRQRKWINKLQFQAGRLSVNDEGDETAKWKSVARTVNDLVESGVPPSSVEIRSILLPHRESVPELPDSPQGFSLVLREIDRFVGSLPQELVVDDERGQPKHVKKVAQMLRGRAVVLIGGDERPEQKEMLEKALELSELIWIATRPGDSYKNFKPYVARPDVAVVLLAIRWVSHSYGEVQKYCQRYGKPLVRLPGGYNPAQVASCVLKAFGIDPDAVNHDAA